MRKSKRFNEEKTKFYVAEIILALEDLHKRDVPHILLFIFIQFKCESMETDFIFTGTGPNQLPLTQIRESKLQQIIDQFSSII